MNLIYITIYYLYYTCVFVKLTSPIHVPYSLIGKYSLKIKVNRITDKIVLLLKSDYSKIDFEAWSFNKMKIGSLIKLEFAFMAAKAHMNKLIRLLFGLSVSGVMSNTV